MDKTLTIVISQLKEILARYDEALNSPKQTEKDENGFLWYIQACEGGIQALLRVLSYNNFSLEQLRQIIQELRQLADLPPKIKERIDLLLRNQSEKLRLGSREYGDK